MSKDRWETISDLLGLIHENKSSEMRQLKQETYLSTEQLKEYIDFLSEKQYLELKNNNGKEQVSITEKGKVFSKIVNLKK